MSEGIEYQNKDKRSSSNEFTTGVPANDMGMDIVFLSEDGTHTIVDCESVDKKDSRMRYVNYISRLIKLYHENSN